MTQVLYGPRLGREGKIRFGCRLSSSTRRAQKYCSRAARMMAYGACPADACEREVFEETGLKVRVKRIVGVYSNPDQLVIYPDGNKVHIVVLGFEAEITGGELGLSNETTEAGFFLLTEMEDMPMHGKHKERVEDATLNQAEAFIK